VRDIFPLGLLFRLRIRTAALAVAVSALLAVPASAEDQFYFAASDNITSALVQKINAETVRIDVGIWHLTEHSISIALLNRFKAGVPVRLIGDRAELFELNEVSKREFYWLANEGVPIRVRFFPTWVPEIMHWKAAIFVGQNVVAFGSANFTPFELAPVSSTNYKDETVLFSDDPAVVNAFKTKFDRMWNDTTREPQSLHGGPPYLKDWDDACATDHTGNCADYRTLYPNPKPMIIDTARLEPDHPLPPDLVWAQGPSFNNRLVQEINNEPLLVQLVVYRLTVDNITTALLNKWNSGVQVQVLLEPIEYVNRKWPEFWLTHANIDKLWAAGVPIKQRVHGGLTHMKTLVTSAYATNASSNYAAAWQRDHNYFISAAAKPGIYQALKDRVTAMWNDSSAFGPFEPGPPDAASLASPGSSATGVSTTPTLVWNIAPFATSYDVYLGTSPSSMTRVGNVPAQLVINPPGTYSWTATAPLQSGATYYWKVVSRTFATNVDPSLVRSSPTQSFTTAGTSTPPPSGPLPQPWSSEDIGAVGLSGSASYSNGTFTLNGAGADIWGTADSFHYVHQSVSGDVEIVARVASLQNTGAYAKAGVMLRASLAADAAHVILDVTPNGTIEFMRRASTGGSTAWLAGASDAPPTWLKLVRSGTTVTGYVSSNGTSWATVGTTTLSIGTTARAGLVVTSHDTGTRNTATFSDVAVTTGSTPPPPPPDDELPEPWVSADVGSVGRAGSASYASGTFTVSGAGADIWGTVDSFHYVHQSVSGDVEMVARVATMQNTGTFAKAGIMLRESLASNAAHVILDVTPGGTIEFMRRASTGGSTAWLAGASDPPPAWLRLVRAGSTVTGYVSSNGTSWVSVGSTTLSIGSTARIGLVVTSHDTGVLNTSTFDNVAVSGSAPPPPPPPAAADIVIYASDVPTSARHGSWQTAADSTSPNGVKLVTSDTGVSNTDNPLAFPAHYFDVSFSPEAGTPYRIWVRMNALGNSKWNDAVWVQFSGALANGSPVYPLNSTSGLLVNLATDSSASSLNGWGWENTAYWLSQPTTLTFGSGPQTLRIQVREDGVQIDQIVLSPNTYLNTAPGPVTNDSTIVPKP
jgi:regulation of enolase protein 1 (concanavalin A-like superfamily)